MKMKRLEFLERARKLAQQQCMDSSCLTEKEFADIKKSVVTGESSEEVELYKKVLEVLTDSAQDMGDIFLEVSRSFEKEEDE